MTATVEKFQIIHPLFLVNPLLPVIFTKSVDEAFLRRHSGAYPGLARA
ncbi:hypothetical protein NDI37_04735 [Funiculus sociatus GB2-A5]|uniref:Uncharacterized protein n=1 Tax=Funiculus sociatus GB2-A5 TaxID=2933946 RepID=A0ABV0JK10_9CYAN|nr:hypothetical protein [Trichocoleus sp. FACHB-832]MBD1907009.1 hypothetical protein [Trichocoleus sp. FACHB-832]MBD2063587.1 hypothetical protein [Trichocoleus sp. FACHB-6]